MLKTLLDYYQNWMYLSNCDTNLHFSGKNFASFHDEYIHLLKNTYNDPFLKIYPKNSEFSEEFS